MRQNILFLALFAFILASTTEAYSQNRTCGAHDKLELHQKNNPELIKKRAAIEKHTQQFASHEDRSSTVYKLPVVVHVIYKNSADNISDAQINSQITALNNAYRKLNDVSGVPSEFASLVADVGIEFHLADKDPSNASTTGITRKYVNKDYWGMDPAIDDMKSSSYGGVDGWDADKYFNIWICKVDPNADILAWSSFPGEADSIDGVVCQPQYFGTTGTVSSPYHLGVTMVHEVGHYLNLNHIWGDGDCSATDNVADTPSALEANYGTPTHPHTTCSSNDMFMNYMDYCDDSALSMFSEGQKSRMLALFAPGGARESLPEVVTSYCTAKGNSVDDEWISKVDVGSFSNSSGADAGYGDYTTQTISFEKGTAKSITLTTGYAGNSFDEWWRVWIDLNQDSDFDDAGELIYDAGSATSAGSVTGSITIPTSALDGNTRMRVAMKYWETGSSAPTQCESFDYGEVEDYAVSITTASSGGSGASDLFISEYIEGSSYNKAIEIANFTGASVDLSDYSIKGKFNGSSTWDRGPLALSGTLADEDVFTIVENSAGSTLLALGDLVSGSSVIAFNGDDIIGLFKNGVLVDVVGGGSGLSDVTMVRKATIADPNTTYTATEWDSYAKDTFTDVGSHTYGSTAPPPASSASDLLISEYVEGSSYNKAIEIANFTGASVDLSDYTIKGKFNGSSTWDRGPLSLSGTLADEGVYAVVENSAGTTLTGLGDLITGSSVMAFNGDDIIGLFKNGVLVDVVGGGSGLSDKTLVRNVGVGPNTTYTVSEWTTYSKDDYSHVGSHVFVSGAKLINSGIENFITEVNVHPNPARAYTEINVSGKDNLNNIQVYLFDITGKEVFSKQWNGVETEFSYKMKLNKYSNGIYFMIIKGDGFVDKKQIVKMD